MLVIIVIFVLVCMSVCVGCGTGRDKVGCGVFGKGVVVAGEVTVA